uniref:protein Shroom3 isoform X2 n=1 Tax=Monopterus albus TaxID=43700 RepID=UPI0009B4D2C1|nr:protein Shroom3-like isoform X2 [Monopterus albus]
MELLEVFYRRKLRKKQKKAELGRSDGALCRSPSEASANSLATGLISKVLRFTSRRSVPASRPHSWHSAKLSEARQELEQDKMDAISSSWHNSYHASASTTDLSSGFDTGLSYLRKSPDQYSSRGSMESLDPTQSSQLHSGAQHHHPLGHHILSGPHHTYSSCHQLSSARSSNSIDHLHSKRDSAYSSFSTSSSIPEYLASTPSFSPERSCSLETVPQRGGGSGEMQQADMRFVQTVYDSQQGLSQEHGLSSTSAALLCNSDSRGGGGVRPGLSRDPQVSVGGVCYHGGGNSSGSVPASNRHSVGPVWGPAASHSSYESLRGAPAPPRRSDSYAAIRNHERPNSWSSQEHARSLRFLQKGSWHHSSGPVASSAAKGSYGAEGQLHTVIEKSPESSPTTKPRQGGGYFQSSSPPEPSSGLAAPTLESGQLILPTGMYPVPQPEPHFAQMPSSSPGPVSSGVYPTLARESSRQQHQGQQGIGGRDEGTIEGRRDERTSSTENGYQNYTSSSSYPQFSYSSSQLWTQAHGAERSADQTSIHSDPVMASRLSQGQGPPTHILVQSQAPPTSQSFPRHFSDSAALQYWDDRELDKDREHPLTHLEIALAEVQRCASPGGDSSTNSHGNSRFVDDSPGPVHSLSVLEKVSHFERRERAGRQRSYSTTSAHKKAIRLRMSEKARNTSCGADDLRNMLARSTSMTKAQRTLSYRGGSSDHMKCRTPADPISALQRSRSSFHLEGSRERDSSKEFPWVQDTQEMLGSMQDTSFSSNDQPSPIPAKHHSLEKKGPRTMPKPQGITITPQLPPQVISPHTPKERHMVSPESRGSSPPALPSVPPVGPHRIGGRRRLTADQKKRSYSEPENMNEVGVLDIETAALFRHGGETSVADRRKMFEPPASRIGGGGPQSTTSRPDLRQLQHDALAEYVERKRSGKRDDREQSKPRPRSVYLQPDNSNHTDTLSFSSSLLSLQDSGTDRSFSSEERRLCSTLPPGADLQSHQSNLFYQGRATTPRPPSHPPPSALAGSFPEPQAPILQTLTHEAGLNGQSQPLNKDRGLGHQQQVAEPQHKQLSGALQSSGPARSSGKSASAEDLLKRTEERQTTSQHHRSLSSPTVETLHQDFPPGDVRMFGEVISETGRCSLADDRPADIQVSAGLIPPQPLQDSLNTIQGSTYTPVTRRERQRNSERHRAHSTATLAASVGLPCPFSPPGTQEGNSTEWQASERLSLAHLDAIVFSGIQQTTTCDGDGSEGVANNGASLTETQVTDRQTRHSLSDPSPLEGTEKDRYRGRAYSFEMKGGHSTNQVSPVTPVPLPHFQLAAPQNNKSTTSFPPPSIRHLSSLRISESSLLSSLDNPKPLESSTGMWQEDCDEVFLQDPPPPSPPPPIKESSIMENFPPPVDSEQETGHKTRSSSEFLNNSSIPKRKSSLPSPPLSPSSSTFPSPVPSLLPYLKPQPSTITTSTTAEDSLGLEYQPLPKREKTSEELQVEMLARQLVLQDCSLAPLLDTWGGKSTVELMAEIFPDSKLVGTSQMQCKDSSQLNDRIHDGICDAAPSVAMDGEMEISLDEDEKGLITRKVDLCEALRRSVAVLQKEKEVLCEEQKHHQALGASLEMLVQEHLKTNEKEKYSMFIGDLEKIVNLLLSLCSRLSRIDRSLLAVGREEVTQEGIAEERKSLQHKRSVLLRQTDDARELKENLDRRQRVVQGILSNYLTEPQLQDYCHFVSSKPSLLIRRRHLEDLIRQGEEQLTRLAETLPADLAEAHGLSRASPFSSLSSMLHSLPPPPLPPSSVIQGNAVRPTTVTSL